MIEMALGCKTGYYVYSHVYSSAGLRDLFVREIIQWIRSEPSSAYHPDNFLVLLIGGLLAFNYVLGAVVT